ncbi:MAG TPA: SurA N-terminal domain-containing protein, partial [Candidatus Cloacimonadota bacterium]|nr:SurA N-terminal domain-containing protein [Candidatus Cloacimonadota bacterium]
MKKYLILILMLVAAVFAVGTEIDRIVATVGGDIILYSDLQRQIIQMRSSGVREELLNSAEVLNNMVEHRLMIQKAKDLGITVDDKAIKSYAERYMAQIKSQFETEADFQAELRRMNTSQRDLMNYFVEQITESELTKQLVAKHISSQMRVEDAEMRAFYEASKDSMAVKPVSWDLRMILREVKPSESAIAAIRAEAETLQQRADNGEDFAALASEYSDCP